MKSLSGAVQVLIVVALIGFGVLCGLAIAILVHKLDIGGVAPLFANAVGAAIGAGITLWFSERRHLQAEAATARKEAAIRRDRARVAASELAVISVYLESLCREIHTKNVTGAAITALHHLNHALPRAPDEYRFLVEAGMVHEYSILIIALPHGRRLVEDLRALPYEHVMERLGGDGSAIYLAEFERINTDIKTAKAGIIHRHW